MFVYGSRIEILLLYTDIKRQNYFSWDGLKLIFIANQFLIMVESIFCSANGSPKAKKIFGIVTFIQLFILLGFRAHSVGTDTPNYIFLFGLLKNGFDVDQFEILNVILMKIIAWLPNSQTVLLCVYAFLTLGLFYLYFYLESEDPCLSIALFSGFMYYYLCFNIMRQALAMGLVSVAVAMLRRNKKNKFWLFAFLAIGFHTSAAVIIPIWVIAKMRIRYSWNLYFFFVIASVSMIAFGRKIVELLLTFFPTYRVYINTGYADEGNVLNPIMYLAILTIITIVWNYTLRSSNDNIYLIMLGVGTVFYFVSTQVEIVNRIVYYYTISVMIILPNLLKRIPQVRNRVPLSVGAHLVVFVYSCLLISRSAHGVVPYAFFWME